MSDIFELFKQIGASSPNKSAPVTHIVAGLGNPGEKYAKTRHNAGFMALDLISQKYGFKIDRLKYKALCGEAEISDKRVLFMKPQTFMNNSGEALREAAAFYKIPSENIIVIFDDISLEPGKLRIRKNGSDGGHNGIKSIIYQLSSDAFPRIKLGVGAKPHPDYDLADWVLGEIPDELRESFFGALTNAADALRLMLGGDIEKAMNLYNRK